MNSMHHKSIKRFTISGQIQDEAKTMRLRSEYYRLVISEMKLAGYVPRLDIDQDFTLDYNEKKQCFEFELTIYGVYVGKKKSEWILGIDGTLVIATQESKSKEFLQERA